MAIGALPLGMEAAGAAVDAGAAEGAVMAGGAMLGAAIGGGFMALGAIGAGAMGAGAVTAGGRTIAGGIAPGAGVAGVAGAWAKLRLVRKAPSRKVIFLSCIRISFLSEIMERKTHAGYCIAAAQLRV
jgi:hypothetical protein